MTPCPSPGPPDSPAHPGGGETLRTGQNTQQDAVLSATNSSDLVRVHEELHKLTANHSELSGLGVIQRQTRVQLTAGLVEVQQSAHKPETQRQT